MNKIIRKPFSGKTTELIKKSAETGMIIITPTKSMEKHTAKMAEDMGLQIPKPINIISYLNNRRFLGIHEKILIDNADVCLQVIFGIETEIDTITIDCDLT